jgi:hypothetical protein
MSEQMSVHTNFAQKMSEVLSEVMKIIKWQNYTVEITKKNVKNTNLRLKPSDPQVIHISIPYSVSYASAMQFLEQPKTIHWLQRIQKKFRENPVKPVSKDSISEEQLQKMPEYRERLSQLLPGMFARWEPILGVRCNKVAIRDTRRQWGSCSIRTRNISISVWLGACPEECIEYVVVHELVHLLEYGHNKRFYGILDQYYPNWRACRERLRLPEGEK